MNILVIQYAYRLTDSREIRMIIRIDSADCGGNMTYKIGEVAKLLGISSETVRYYEREGVIQSQKIDQESGYRYYEALDINALMRVRMYRNYGFTLQEAKEMLNTCTAGRDCGAAGGEENGAAGGGGLE